MVSENKNYLKLNDISSYKIAFHLSNKIWTIVLTWDYFAKDTVGKQYTRCIDSISANIAEGFGRYFKKDKINFYRYAYGSLIEAKDWTQKAKSRNLISEEEYMIIFNELEKLPKEINSLIKYTNLKLNQ